ncbi:MAG: mevalonate kinase [Myxococcota bacterium]
MSFQAVTSEAPGKVILFGEHAVVYGSPAIGFPLGRTISVEVRPGDGHISLTTSDDVEVPAPKNAASPRELIEQALGPWFAKADVDVHFGFPPMSGFGSSAALAVALHRARSELENRDSHDPELTLKRIINVERVAHSKPSGVDPAICLSEGMIQFHREHGRGKPEIRSVLPAKALFFLVGTAGSHGGTRQSVNRVAEMKKKSPSLVKAAMDVLGEAAIVGAKGIRKGELDAIGDSMNLAHGVLSGLGLVGSDVERAVQLTRHGGALGSKMSGAGGEGGAFIALFPSRKAAEAARAELGLASIAGWVERVAPSTAGG